MLSARALSFSRFKKFPDVSQISRSQNRDAGMVPRPRITTVTYFIRTEAPLYPAEGIILDRVCLRDG
jgi:hypothetical protein